MTRRKAHLILPVLGFFLASMFTGFAGTKQRPTAAEDKVKAKEDSVLKDLLTGSRPPTPREVLKSLRIEAGFRVELAAAEPRVTSPVALAWDEDGRLYVAEDIDYPEKPKPGQKPLSRIRLLYDSKGDGHYDRSVIFADNLQWTTGIAPWKGGIYVAAPPQLLYLKDTDGDGKADVRRVVYDGFGTRVAERAMNNLRWGPDNKIYGITCGNGGEIRRPTKPALKPVNVRGRDFRFDPRLEDLELLAGTGVFGNCFDDWGNRFVFSPGGLLRHVALPGRYLDRNPFLTVSTVIYESARAKQKLASISPPERWRVVRQKYWQRWVNTTYEMRSARFPARELEPKGFVTGGAGGEIYRGQAFPRQYQGNSFTAEPAGNAVVRLRPEPQGVTFDAVALTQDREFLASTDNWFRPVNVVNGPDGCLYVCDMCRELIEFPDAIPDDILKYINISNGRDRGRIWRIVPAGFQRPAPPRLGQASTAELVATLAHADSWWRETAQRLLFERQDRSALAPLRNLVRKAATPQGRFHALAALDGLNGLDTDTLLQALADPHTGVAEQALRVSEKFVATSQVLEKVLGLAQSNQPRVRFQVAFSLGTVARDARAQTALAGIMARDVDDPWIPLAVLSSVGECPGALFTALVPQERFLKAPAAGRILDQLAGMIGARNDTKETHAFFRAMARPPFADRPELQQSLFLGLADALARSDRSLNQLFDKAGQELKEAKALIARLLETSLKVAVDQKKSPAERIDAIRFLRHAPFEIAAPVLADLLSASLSPEIQLAGIQSLSGQAHKDVGKILLERWRGISPRCRSEAIEALFRKEARLQTLLDGLEKKVIQMGELEPQRRQTLLKLKDKNLRQRAEKVLAGQTTANRRQVLEKYQAALKLKGDPAKGALVFAESCAVCHRLGSAGKDVGPDLNIVKQNSLDELLLAILDPNREVAGDYINFSVITKNGRFLTGIIVAETAGSITLRRAEGVEDTVLRSEIEELVNSGQSLMPEGLEQQINLQQMADLLALIKTG